MHNFVYVHTFALGLVIERMAFDSHLGNYFFFWIQTLMKLVSFRFITKIKRKWNSMEITQMLLTQFPHSTYSLAIQAHSLILTVVTIQTVYSVRYSIWIVFCADFFSFQQSPSILGSALRSKMAIHLLFIPFWNSLKRRVTDFTSATFVQSFGEFNCSQ